MNTDTIFAANYVLEIPVPEDENIMELSVESNNQKTRN